MHRGDKCSRLVALAPPDGPLPTPPIGPLAVPPNPTLLDEYLYGLKR